MMAYAFTFWTCYVLMKEYEKVASMRLSFLQSEQRRPDQFTVKLVVHGQFLFLDVTLDWLGLNSQVLVRNVPSDPDESISESVEHYFLVNHPDHYLTHQVIVA